MKLEEIKRLITHEVPDSILGEVLGSTPNALSVDLKLLHQVCECLHAAEETYFDQLSCLTGLDNGPEVGTIEVIYNLNSIPRNLQLILKVEVSREDPVVDSVSDIWRAADWHEREAYDLLGIRFNNHPDLRRILLPNDWVGYPLRKDYETQEMYHEVKVKY